MALPEMFANLRLQHNLRKATSIVRTPPTSVSLNSTRTASTIQQRRRKQEPYRIAQARARKAANLSRQETLQLERSKGLGDPVRGLTTDFVKSFDTGTEATTFKRRKLEQETQGGSVDPATAAHAAGAPPSTPNIHADAPAAVDTATPPARYLNFFTSPAELEAALEGSRALMQPVRPALDDPQLVEERVQAHAAGHANAAEALRRITATEGGSSKDRLRANVRRCIDVFGRHNTDLTLRPRPGKLAQAVSRDGRADPTVNDDVVAVDQALALKGEALVGRAPRAGADTGSSEVQIAILTAKIRTLANFLETRGQKDKVNKRNLRLLVHRRQKLLSYLRRKERGGERWQHCIKMLGLTEATWKGEISL